MNTYLIEQNNQAKWIYFQTYFFVKIEFSLSEEETELAKYNIKKYKMIDS